MTVNDYELVTKHYSINKEYALAESLAVDF